MPHYYWNNWYLSWGWFLWFGVVFLFFSSLGIWAYTYQLHRRFDDEDPGQEALDIINERYARGQIKEDEYILMKAQVLGEVNDAHAERIRDIPQSGHGHPYSNPASGK